MKKQRKEVREKREVREIVGMATRYVLAIAFGFAIFIFYLIFTPLTVYPVYALLKFFGEAQLKGLLLTFNGHQILFVKACIAGSAYYLLLILNLVTRNITPAKRIGVFFFSALLLLIVNIVRILIMISLLNSSQLFDITHKFFWYALSTVFVLAIWIASIKIFKIREVPIASDVLYL